MRGRVITLETLHDAVHILWLQEEHHSDPAVESSEHFLLVDVALVLD